MRCPSCGKELTSNELKNKKCNKCGLTLPLVGNPDASKEVKKLPDLPWKKSGIYKDDSLPPPQRTKVVPIQETQESDAMEGQAAFKAGEINFSPANKEELIHPVEHGIITDAPVESASIEDKRLIGALPPPPPPKNPNLKKTPQPSPIKKAPLPPPPPPSESHLPLGPRRSSYLNRGEPTLRVQALPPPPPSPSMWEKYGGAILMMVAFVALTLLIAGLVLIAT